MNRQVLKDLGRSQSDPGSVGARMLPHTGCGHLELQDVEVGGSTREVWMAAATREQGRCAGYRRLRGRRGSKHLN